MAGGGEPPSPAGPSGNTGYIDRNGRGAETKKRGRRAAAERGLDHARGLDRLERRRGPTAVQHQAGHARSALKRALEGKWPGGRPPYGYVVGPDEHLTFASNRPGAHQTTADFAP